MFFDNKVHLVFGAKGSGKTTLAAYICAKEAGKHDVFSNYPLKGAYKITLDDLRSKAIPSGSIILIDEAAGILNCRDWRSTGMDLIEFMQLARHIDVTVYFFSQSLTALDCQITDLCDDAISCTKLFWGLSRYNYCRRELRKNGMPIFVSTHSHFLVYRPKYYSYFDTHYLSESYNSKPSLQKVSW